MQKFLMLDVESVGLHGEGFAVGVVVVGRSGILEEVVFSCAPEHAEGSEDDLAWVQENVPDLPRTHQTPREVRDAFWSFWQKWRLDGAVLVSDCAWPVETGFLSACVRDSPDERNWRGPYPLYDLASILFAYGENPLLLTKRMPNELPAHHPLMDARQSARQLVTALRQHHPEPGWETWSQTLTTQENDDVGT